MTFRIFINFFEGRKKENKSEWHNGDVSARGTNVRDLLKETNGEEKYVGISSELFKQKLGQEGPNGVFGGSDVVLIVFSLLALLAFQGHCSMIFLASGQS